MTDKAIQWGGQIPVNRKRPEWMRDHDWYQVAAVLDRGEVQYPNQGRGETIQNTSEWAWSQIVAVMLPADHPYYTATREAPNGPTDAERRLAELVAEYDRLNARVSELLAANTEQVNKRRALAEQNDKLAAGLDKMQERIADLRDDLDGARHENGTVWAIVERQYGLLDEAARHLRAYRDQHKEQAAEHDRYGTTIQGVAERCKASSLTALITRIEGTTPTNQTAEPEQAPAWAINLAGGNA